MTLADMISYFCCFLAFNNPQLYNMVWAYIDYTVLIFYISLAVAFCSRSIVNVCEATRLT
jgi:hypothetical protein